MRKFLTQHARNLRNNPTDAEKHLWYALRLNNLGVKFRRQVVLGQYIVDFACLEKRLIIEIDGGQHAGNSEDLLRDAWLRGEGFEVLRFWNTDVLGNREGVLEEIMRWMAVPLPGPPRRGEGMDGGNGWRK